MRSENSQELWGVSDNKYFVLFSTDSFTNSISKTEDWMTISTNDHIIMNCTLEL